jgi:predicted nucleic acid-binding Zn finger protein
MEAMTKEGKVHCSHASTVKERKAPVFTRKHYQSKGSCSVRTQALSKQGKLQCSHAITVKARATIAKHTSSVEVGE